MSWLGGPKYDTYEGIAKISNYVDHEPHLTTGHSSSTNMLLTEFELGRTKPRIQRRLSSGEYI